MLGELILCKAKQKNTFRIRCSLIPRVNTSYTTSLQDHYISVIAILSSHLLVHSLSLPPSSNLLCSPLHKLPSFSLCWPINWNDGCVIFTVIIEQSRVYHTVLFTSTGMTFFLHKNKCHFKLIQDQVHILHANTISFDKRMCHNISSI